MLIDVWPGVYREGKVTRLGARARNMQDKGILATIPATLGCYKPDTTLSQNTDWLLRAS